VVVPVYEKVNEKFGTLNNLNFGGKLYLLYYDTDIDLIALGGGSRPFRYGADFSRNMSPSFEIHGEYAAVGNYDQQYVDGEGRLGQRNSNACSYLMGIRYETRVETTFILEYYRNGLGFSPGEIGSYFSMVDGAYATFLSSGNVSPLASASMLQQTAGYGGVNPERQYFYFRATQKDALKVVYFNPSITWIRNLEDGSYAISPELLYSPVTNLELRLKFIINSGGRGTEFGEKAADFKTELRMRYFF